VVAVTDHLHQARMPVLQLRHEHRLLLIIAEEVDDQLTGRKLEMKLRTGKCIPAVPRRSRWPTPA
jgi:hypothetical protein